MISIFTSMTEPDKRGDAYEPALECYTDLADEVQIVGENWPREFNWPYIGETFQQGYEACSGDWVIRADLDYLFHERDFGKIKQALRDYPNSPGVSFYKHQLIQPHKFNLKSRLVIAVNKKVFGDRIRFNGGGDLTQPTLDNRLLELSEIPQAGVAFWNYEKLTKTEEQIMDDVGRMDRAWQRHFGKWLYSEDGTDESAYAGWLQMVVGRENKPSENIRLEAHPKYIQETIRNLQPTQFGYNGFNNFTGGYFEKG